MINFQLTTDKDRREAAGIERRRSLEQERRKRIFNPRERLFGLDYDTLEKQIREKEAKTNDEALVDRIFDEQRIKQDQLALAYEKKEREERIKLQQEINYFRMCCQRPEDRREFDLNDPNFIRNSVPARSSDNDVRCGPSSAQKFEGEDLAKEERGKVQREQIKAWLDQQMKEKEAADKDRKGAELAYTAAILARDQRAMQLDEMEKDCRKQLQAACLRFNKALADERKADEMQRNKKEHNDALAEMYNFMTSDMLTENPNVSKSLLGADRQIGYLYKGMTEEQRVAIRQYQLGQIEEAKARRAQEAKFSREFDDYINGTQHTVSLMDKEANRTQKENLKKMCEENMKLAEEQKLRKQFMDKVVYTNQPTEEFYDQFNKSTR